MPARLLALVALLVAPPGCYASHERVAAHELACTEVPPACAEPAPTFARGVCAEDGEVRVFLDGTSEVVCSGIDGDATRFGQVGACAPPRPLSRRFACCPPSDEPFLSSWVFEGSALGTGVRIETTGEGCEVIAPEVPAGPMMPWRPTVLCDDPLGWSGVPLVFSLLVPGADPCAGAAGAERCVAERAGDRIVVSTERANASGGCEPRAGDEVAECAVLPLPEGHYEVVDRSGRVLGALEVPGAPPAPRAAVCTPIGG